MKSIINLGARTLYCLLFISFSISYSKAECNLIQNDNFSNGHHNWIAALQEDKGAEGNATFVNKNATFIINALGKDKFDISLEQRGIHIQEGESYQIRFTAIVETAKTITVAVSDIGNAYSTLSQSSKKFNLTAEQTVYEYAFNANVTDYTTRLIFMLGADTVNIIIDDVSMIKLNCENCLPKGTACDDRDACTINDKEDGFCNCIGELITENQIINGDFSDHFYGAWGRTIHTTDGAIAELVHNQGEAHFEIEQTGIKNWNIALEQRNLSIEAGKHYKISFKAKATETRDINVKISDVGGVFATYFSQDVALTDNFQDYTFNYEAPVTDTEVRIIFNMGLDTSDVTIDDVYFERYNCEPCDQFGLACDDGNSCTINDKYNAACECVSYTEKQQYINNGNFSSQFAGWSETIYSDSGAVATTNFDKHAYFKIEKDGTKNWHISLEQRGIPFVAGENYSISFKAKAAISRLINVKISDYPNASLTYFNQNLALTEDWKAYNYNFSPEATDNFTRIIFNMGIDTMNNSVNEIFIDDVSIINTACSQYTEVLPQDSLILLQFYKQNCKTDCKLEWCLSCPVHTWEGVEIENERVVALKVAGKGLSGNIDSLNLPFLKVLDLSYNNFNNSLADFSNLPQLTHFDVSKNQLSFKAVEMNFNTNSSIENFVYSPQYIGKEETYVLNEGQYWWIGSVDEPFANTEGLSFQWKQNDKEIAGVVIDSFRIENMQVEDIGIYTLHISNESLVADMEIISKPNYVIMPGYDISGQEIFNNEIMVMFDNKAEMDTFANKYLNPPYNGKISFQCDCNRLLYLFQFESSEEAAKVLLDIDKKRALSSTKIVAKSDPNAFIGIENMTTIPEIWKWNPQIEMEFMDEVFIYLLDSGLDETGLGGTDFLMEEAPSNSCDDVSAPGYGFVANQNKISIQYQDSVGHGTYGYHAITRGMENSPNLKVVPIKIFDKSGKGSLFHFICGLFHSIDQQADIINVSAGYYGGKSSILETALQIAQQQGIFITSAAGNEGINIDSIPQFPASYAGKFYQQEKLDSLGNILLDSESKAIFDSIPYDNIISVAALNSENMLAEFSNYGNRSVTISAYGENLTGFGLGEMETSCSGTSMATFYTTRELATEMAKDKSRSHQEIWKDFEKNYLVSNENLKDKTITGKQINVALEKVQLKSTKNVDASNQLHIFPNPSNGKVSLAFNFLNDTINEGIEIKVFNIFGSEVLSQKTFYNESIQIDMRVLDKGTYLIEMNAQNKSFYGRVIIN